MNIILAEQNEIIDNTLVVTDRRAEHLIKVIRVKLGDKVRVGVINGKKGLGCIVAAKMKYPFSVTLAVELNKKPIDTIGIDLVLALPRPIMLKRILSQVSALGVGTIHLVHAKRVEKSFWNSNILNPEEYRSHLLQGLEQAVDTRLPKVCIHTKFKPFVEDFLPGRAKDYSYKILAHPHGGAQLGTIIQSSGGRVLLAVGPEGGWIDYEVEKFTQRDFSCCSLGPRILKVDTAVVALHSRISAVKEMLGS